MKRCAHQVPHAAVHFRKAATSITLCAALALTACSSSDRKGEAADDSPSHAQAPTSSTPANPKETVEKEAINTPVRFRDLSSGFVGGSSLVMAVPGCCLVASAPD